MKNSHYTMYLTTKHTYVRLNYYRFHFDIALCRQISWNMAKTSKRCFFSLHILLWLPSNSDFSWNQYLVTAGLQRWKHKWNGFTLQPLDHILSCSIYGMFSFWSYKAGKLICKMFFSHYLRDGIPHSKFVESFQLAH